MKKFRILIVDDNDLFRQTLRTTLQEAFPTITIDEEPDGGKALQKVDASFPGLIFMDIRLPGESGLELTKKVKANHPEIVVVILTSYDLPEYRQAALLSLVERAQPGRPRGHLLRRQPAEPTGDPRPVMR